MRFGALKVVPHPLHSLHEARGIGKDPFRYGVMTSVYPEVCPRMLLQDSTRLSTCVTNWHAIAVCVTSNPCRSPQAQRDDGRRPRERDTTLSTQTTDACAMTHPALCGDKQHLPFLDTGVDILAIWVYNICCAILTAHTHTLQPY